MESNAERAAEERDGRDWLAALPARAAAEAEAAVRVLPKTGAAAGADLPLAIAAWGVAEPAAAARLFEEWLGAADAEGNLAPAGPVAAQLAEWVAARLPDPDAFRRRIAPGLARCVLREFDRYDAQGMGLPLWPSAAEAWFPAEFVPGRFTIDLAVLLSNEAAAFVRLAEDWPELNRALGEADGEKRDLDNWIQEDFWDRETALFLRHDEGRDSVPDESPCGLVPLLWGDATDAMTESLRFRAAGLDPAAWPARTWVLFFALLLRTPHGSVIGRMRRRGLPAGASPVERAAWTILTTGAESVRAPALAEIPRAVRWADAHGRRIARGLLLAGAVLAAGLLVHGFLQRESRDGGSVEDLERRARLACESGAHARAALLYGQAARRGHETYFRYRQANEWMHLEEYAAAETAYRDILVRRPEPPNVRLNLALAVWRQGRREEALALYRTLATEPAAADHPELAGRARLAAELIGRQLGLDGAAAGPEPAGQR